MVNKDLDILHKDLQKMRKIKSNIIEVINKLPILFVEPNNIAL